VVMVGFPLIGIYVSGALEEVYCALYEMSVVLIRLKTFVI